MRKIRWFLTGLLLGAVAWGQTDEPFNAVRVTPRWNVGGGIDLYVSNQTKMPVSTDRLAVELRLKATEPCRLDYEKRLDLKPGETVKLAVADVQGARKCLGAQSTIAAHAPLARALRFVRPPINQAATELVTPNTDALVVNATWKVRGRALRSQTHWLVKPESQ
jgi:hypothetical protein